MSEATETNYEVDVHEVTNHALRLFSEIVKIFNSEIDVTPSGDDTKNLNLGQIAAAMIAARVVGGPIPADCIEIAEIIAGHCWLHLVNGDYPIDGEHHEG